MPVTLVNCVSLGLVREGSGEVGGVSLAMKYGVLFVVIIFSQLCVAVDLQQEHRVALAMLHFLKKHIQTIPEHANLKLTLPNEHLAAKQLCVSTSGLFDKTKWGTITFVIMPALQRQYPEGQQCLGSAGMVFVLDTLNQSLAETSSRQPVLY